MTKIPPDTHKLHLLGHIFGLSYKNQSCWTQPWPERELGRTPEAQGLPS